jgi:hypothetical protein
MPGARMRERSWRIPLFISGIFLLSQAFSLPSPVRDAATLHWASGYKLQLPLGHILFTPFFSIADYLTVLSVKQMELFVGYLFASFLLLWPWRRALLAIFLFMVFVAWGALVPRLMAKLVPKDPDTLVIDFHSHSRYSHDGRPMFTPERNMAWHRLQGYDAAFITDHNRIEASDIAARESEQTWSSTGYRSLEGEEVSLAKTHLVILGNHERIDNHPYDSDPLRIQFFIADMHKAGFPVIASLPEYWLYHWAPLTGKEEGKGTVNDFVAWGMDGFEIVNSAPKALDFPADYRAQIVDLCRNKNLFITGISDNHGYGYATAVWNAMTIPGWRLLDSVSLEKAVLNQLKTKGFYAVRVLERAKYWPEGRWTLLVSPFMNVLTYWRTLQASQVLAWVGWIWLLYALDNFFRKSTIMSLQLKSLFVLRHGETKK